MEERLTNLKGEGQRLYNRANRVTGGVLGIVVDMVDGFTKARGAEAAASITYYVLFSIFPLLLSVIAIGSYFLEDEQVMDQIVQFVQAGIPVAADMILQNIEEVLEARGTFGVIGVGSLIWSASAAFMSLFRNINRAWMRASPLNTLLARLVGIVVIFALVLVIAVIRVASATASLLPTFGIELLDDFYESFLWLLLSVLVPLVLTFLIFISLYRWIPNTKVRWSEAFWGALVASVGWELTTNLFTYSLSQGILQYKVVYGSLGTMIALLFWIYLNSTIILIGAHLSAAIARNKRPINRKLDDMEEGLVAHS
ncbi:MAG: YihY/virulence factor BrkB family protein [Anaerolineales bacterium]|jgi:membrane protein